MNRRTHAPATDDGSDKKASFLMLTSGRLKLKNTLTCAGEKCALIRATNSDKFHMVLRYAAVFL